MVHRNMTANDTAAELICGAAQPLTDPEEGTVEPLLRQIGDARIVLLGESTHGSEEFYRFRARITRELIIRKQFTRVAVEADWPDAARIDHYVRDLTTPPSEWRAFTRFPTWMWRNTAVQDFVEWLRRHNAPRRERVSFHGLDLYSLFTSIERVLAYLERVDPAAAEVARSRYDCLANWQEEPTTYGRDAMADNFELCRKQVVDNLVDLMEQEIQYAASDGDTFVDALHNARLVANAEEYYRNLYLGTDQSWNLRDSHMFDTLCALLNHRGGDDRVVVWEHNSHVGDARATDMHARGQHNLGQLCRQKFGDDVFIIGFGTDSGTVAAAGDWGDPMQVMNLNPAIEGSWERLCHDCQLPAFHVDLRRPVDTPLGRLLTEVRPQRAIGVIYRPETEWASHYFRARLGHQFDTYVWFDRTRAVRPLEAEQMEGMPDTYPFGL